MITAQNFKKIVATMLFAALLLPLSATAGTSTPAAKIVEFQNYGGWGYVRLDPTAGVNNVQGCSLFDSWFVIDLVYDDQKLIWAQLQLAFATGVPVQIYALTGNGGGTNGYNFISGVVHGD